MGNDRTLIYISNRMRIADDLQQWVLQEQRGNITRKSTGWTAVRWCRTRLGLEIAIRDLRGPGCQALQEISARWPERHPANRLTTPQDYGGLDQAAA